MKVAVFWTNRSEEGLLKPVIKEMEKLDIKVITGEKLLDDFLMMIGDDKIDASDLGDYYWKVFEFLVNRKPHLVFASFDREEMLMVALASKTLGIPVAQIHAGDTGSPEGSLNHSTRWAISAYADLLFCNGKKSFARAYHFRALMHDLPVTYSMPNPTIEIFDSDWNFDEFDESAVEHANVYQVYEVGSTAFDDIELEEPEELPDPDFDMVLLNPPVTKSDLETVASMLGERNILWVKPNGDKGSDDILKFALSLQAEIEAVDIWYEELPRAEFLWCLKHAKRIIGNSSSFCTEAPTLRMGQYDNPEGLFKSFPEKLGIILIGDRNRGRDFVVARTGASKRIAEIVKEYLKDA